MAEQTTPSWEEMELQVQQRTVHEHRDEVDLAEALLNHVNQGFQQMRSVRFEEEHGQKLFELTIRATNSVRCAFDLALKGYYTQALTLLRSAWEDWLNIAYLHLYREVPAKDWNDRRKRPRPKKMRKLVAQKLAKSDDGVTPLQSGLDVLYDEMSAFAHASEESLRVLIERRDGKLWIRLGGHFDTNLLKIYMNLHYLVCNVLLGSLELFVAEQKWLSRSRELHSQVRQWRSQLKSSSSATA